MSDDYDDDDSHNDLIFRFCVNVPSVKDENGKFQEFLPKVSSDPKQFNDFFDSAINPEPRASSPPTDSESSMMVAESEGEPAQTAPNYETEAEPEKNTGEETSEDQWSHLDLPPPSVQILSEENSNERILENTETEPENSEDQRSHLDVPPPSVQILSEENRTEILEAITETEDTEMTDLDIAPPSVQIVSESYLDVPPPSVQIVSEIRAERRVVTGVASDDLNHLEEDPSYLEEMPPTPAVSPPRCSEDSDNLPILMPPSPCPAPALQESLPPNMMNSLTAVFDGRGAAQPPGPPLPRPILVEDTYIRQRRVMTYQPGLGLGPPVSQMRPPAPPGYGAVNTGTDIRQQQQQQQQQQHQVVQPQLGMMQQQLRQQFQHVLQQNTSSMPMPIQVPSPAQYSIPGVGQQQQTFHQSRYPLYQNQNQQGYFGQQQPQTHRSQTPNQLQHGQSVYQQLQQQRQQLQQQQHQQQQQQHLQQQRQYQEQQRLQLQRQQLQGALPQPFRYPRPPAPVPPQTNYQPIRPRPPVAAGGPSCVPVSAVASPPNRSVGDITRAQLQDTLTEQEKGEFRKLREYLLQKCTEESSKEKVVRFFQGCDQSLRDIFREANLVMNFSERVISVLRACYSGTCQEKAVATIPSPQTSPVPFQLEENVVQCQNQNYAQAALQAFQSFLANASVERLPALRTLLLGLLRTNIGVKTFCEKTGISFSHDNREFAGSTAQQFLQNIFPYFRQAITMKSLDLTSLHGVFANIQLTVLPLKKEQLNAESANNFEEQMRKGLKTKQSVQLLKLLVNKCLTLEEFLQTCVLRSELEFNQLQLGFDQYKIAVRINPRRFEIVTTELEKSILQTSGEKILTEKLHTMSEPQTKRGYLEDFHKALESSDPEMVKAFSVTYFENNRGALEALSALIEKVGRDRTVPPELCLPPPGPSVSQVTEPEVRSVETVTAKLPKKRGRPLGWRKPQPVSVSPCAPEHNNREDDLQTPPPLSIDDQPRSQSTTAPAASAPILKASRKKSSDVNKNIVFTIFVKKLDEANITRRSQIKPHFICLLNKEIDMETFLDETNLIDSKSRANESNMKSLRYAFPQFLDLFKEKTIIPKDLHWSFADISYDSDQERCILRSESRRNSSERSSEAVVVVPPPIIASSSLSLSTSSIPVETNPVLCLDFRLLASWDITAFDKQRQMKVIFTSKHLLFIPDPTIDLDDLTDGFQFQHKLFPDGKSGKLWFPGSKSDIFFQIMETLEDFENLFLNRHGVSEKMFLVERGAFQELSVEYDLSSGPVYGIVHPTIIRPEKEIENQENLCFSLLNDTSGTDQRMLFRGYIRRSPSQCIFGVLLSEFLLISGRDEYHSLRDSMFGGEDVQVRICKINQKTKLKLICPIKSEDQPLDLWMRTPELKMANILETEEEISASCLDSLNNNVLVAIPKSQWSHFFGLIQRSLGLHLSFEAKKIKSNVECVAKYSTKLGRSAFHFYAYYFSKGESDKYLAEDINKLDVLVVPCRTDEEEESPPEKYNIKAGVYIERVQSHVHSVKLGMKENSTSKTSERMTVRMFQLAKYVSQAHLNRESMLTRVDILTEAIEHRYTAL